MFQIRLFVVSPQNGELREATQPDKRVNASALIAQHLKQQPEVVAEGWLLWPEDQQPGFESFFGGLLELKPPVLFIKESDIHHCVCGRQIALRDP
jgi:hypothetical protein